MSSRNLCCGAAEMAQRDPGPATGRDLWPVNRGSVGLRAGDLSQYPVAEGADLRFVAARRGIDQPIGMAIVADQVEGLDQATVGDLILEQRPGQDRHAMARHRRVRLIGLRAHAGARPLGEIMPGYTSGLEPLRPPDVAGIEDR